MQRVTVKWFCCLVATPTASREAQRDTTTHQAQARINFHLYQGETDTSAVHLQGAIKYPTRFPSPSCSPTFASLFSSWEPRLAGNLIKGWVLTSPNWDLVADNEGRFSLTAWESHSMSCLLPAGQRLNSHKLQWQSNYRLSLQFESGPALWDPPQL